MKKIMILILLIVISGCAQSGEISYDDQILINKAVSSALENGVQECDYFSDVRLKQKCVEEVQNILTNEGLSAEEVEPLDSSAFNIILSEGDESRCYEIKNLGQRDLCLSSLSRINEINYVREAVNLNDISICDSDEDTAKCRDKYYFLMSVEKGEDLCGSILDDNMKEGCNLAKNA